VTVTVWLLSAALFTPLWFLIFHRLVVTETLAVCMCFIRMFFFSNTMCGLFSCSFASGPCVHVQADTEAELQVTSIGRTFQTLQCSEEGGKHCVIAVLSKKGAQKRGGRLVAGGVSGRKIPHRNTSVLPPRELTPLLTLSSLPIPHHHLPFALPLLLPATHTQQNHVMDGCDCPPISLCVGHVTKLPWQHGAP